MPTVSAHRNGAQGRKPALRLPRRHRAVLEGLSLLMAAAGIGALVWYASTTRGGRSELAGTSELASGIRAATGEQQQALAASPQSCKRPVFRTAARYGIWSSGHYNVFNNMWDEPNPPASGPGSQQLYVCSYDSWYVVADMPAPGQPADSVKTYPNVQENFPSVPLEDFTELTSTFAASGPDRGDYEFAYDTWLNGVASKGSNEVMIWSYNHGQTPAGSPEATASFAGVKYTVWRTPDSSYIAFVTRTNLARGELDLLSFYQWLMAKGWLPRHSELGQVDYGAEIASTGGVPARFSVTKFSLSARYARGPS